MDRRLEVVKRSRTDPVFYVEKVLGEKPWAIQKRIVESVVSNKRTAVKSCHGAGKSFTAARTCVWFLQNFANSVVLTTAPSYQQVQDVLWKEIRLAWAKANKDIVVGRLFDGQPRLEIDKTWFCHGFATDDPSNFQGTHAPHVLIIFDEACGISPKIWQALDGNLSSEHVRFLAIGNPTDPSNNFFDECASSSTNTITISAFDTPNFTAFGITDEDIITGEWEAMVTGQLPYPELTTPAWVADTLAKHGHESAYYQSRVLGQFPQQSTDSLIQMSWITRAKSLLRRPRADEVTKVDVGVDVARTGEDETVISAFAWHEDEPQQVLLRTATQQDTEKTADQCMSTARDLHRMFPDAVVTLRVDGDGLGAGVVDKLKRYTVDNGTRAAWFKVHEFRAGASPRNAELFKNTRAEAWWHTRTLFEEGRVGLLDDALQESQLVSIKFSYADREQIRIERKEEAKRRGVKSPDRADATMMALAKVKRVVPHVAPSLLMKTPIAGRFDPSHFSAEDTRGLGALFRDLHR